MTDRELMQQALSALTQASPSGWSMDSTKRHYGTIEALRARLAQPEQEPINYEEWRFNPMTGKPLWGEQPEQEPDGWIDVDGTETIWQKQKPDWTGAWIPAYYAPPQREWQGLTDEEISAVDWKQNETLHDFARAIEAKLKEKNA